MPGPGVSEPAPIYRVARPADAPQISALYEEEYSPRGEEMRETTIRFRSSWSPTG